MKKYHFMEMVRMAKAEKKFLIKPPMGRNMPFCHRCQRSVDAANLEHLNGSAIEIRVRCHGEEDSCRIEFPYRLRSNCLDDPDAGWAIKRAMADYVAFESSHREV